MVTHSIGSPAHAGIDRNYGSLGLAWWWFPRTRGDRPNKGKIIYQDPKQTVAEYRGQRPGRRPPACSPRPVPEPSEAEQWAALTPSQRRWVLQINLPGFTPPG